MSTQNDSFTIRLPKPSVQNAPSLVLVLLIIVGLIQTVQLFALQQTASAIKVSPSSSPASAPASSGSGSSLPTMVGGC